MNTSMGTHATGRSSSSGKRGLRNPRYFLYAHCDKLFVKVGDLVVAGQKIATVGNTYYSKDHPQAHLLSEERALPLRGLLRPLSTWRQQG